MSLNFTTYLDLERDRELPEEYERLLLLSLRPRLRDRDLEL